MLSHTVKTIALHAAVSHAVQLEFFDIWDVNPGPIPPINLDYINIPDPFADGVFPTEWLEDLADDMIVGGETTIQCENENGKVTEVQCSSGTQHCYDNSEVYC